MDELTTKEIKIPEPIKLEQVGNGYILEEDNYGERIRPSFPDKSKTLVFQSKAELFNHLEQYFTYSSNTLKSDN